MKNIKYIVLSILTLGLVSCENEPLNELRDRNNDEGTTIVLPDLTSGSADFSNYVAIGPSFTAGFTDNGLFIAAQENSFPNIIAGKFANAGGGTFTQPWMNDNFGGLAAGGTRITGPRLVFGGAGPVPLEAVIGPVTVSTDIVLNNPTGPFNNLGIPGAKSFHFIAPGYGNIANFPAAANPYAVRVTGNTPNATILELATAQNPTFFTADLIGGNDVLGYATAGGDANIDQITDQGTFDFAFNTIITALSANAKGVVTNIPYVTSLPYFTTVPHNPIPLDAATAGFLNSGSAYGAYNAGLDGVLAFLSAPGNVGTLQFLFPAPTPEESLNLATAEMERRKIMFEAGAGNAVVIIDEDLTDLTSFNPALVNMRQATADDLVVLPASSFIGTEAVPGNPQTVNGVAIPLADRWILTPEEQAEVAAAVDGFNATIAAVASSNENVVMVDVNSILQQASSTGIMFDDYNLNTDLVFGGLVSLDGVHLTARGYALMANSFLQAIDAAFGSNFEASGNLAKAGDFPTNYSPTLQ